MHFTKYLDACESTESTGLKIWLDDERDPKDPFWQQEKGADGDEVWCKTAEEAIEHLKTGNVIYISLDHDLGTKLTGYDVAKFVEEGAHNGTLPKLSWSIHTDNPAGYQNIAMALMKADKFWSVNCGDL